MRAADHSLLREILHPERDPVAIGYSLAHAVVGPGDSSLRHGLTAIEVYYFLAGTGCMYVNDESIEIQPGVAVVVPKNAVQWVRNTGETDIEFLCIVDPAWREEYERVPKGP